MAMACDKKVVPVKLHFTTVIPSTWKASENKSPIIFIHGLFDSGISWNRVKNRICKDTGRKGYIITLRNHGKSVWSDEITTEHFIADLENFMANQNISRATIVAHCIGSKPAIHLALRKPEMVEKLVVEEMRIHKDDNQMQDYQEFLLKLKLAEEHVEKFPPSMSETEAHKKLQQLTSNIVFKKVAGEASKLKPIAFTLPVYKDKDGTFKWNVHLKPILRNLETIELFHYELEEKEVYLGETLFISAEYSKLQVIDEKELILKHFPNAEVLTAKGVFHCYHTEKAFEFAEKIIDFIGE